MSMTAQSAWRAADSRSSKSLGINLDISRGDKRERSVRRHVADDSPFISNPYICAAGCPPCNNKPHYTFRQTTLDNLIDSGEPCYGGSVCCLGNRNPGHDTRFRGIAYSQRFGP